MQWLAKELLKRVQSSFSNLFRIPEFFLWCSWADLALCPGIPGHTLHFDAHHWRLRRETSTTTRFFVNHCSGGLGIPKIEILGPPLTGTIAGVARGRIHWARWAFLIQEIIYAGVINTGRGCARPR